jgi:hypothetical protein
MSTLNFVNDVACGTIPNSEYPFFGSGSYEITGARFIRVVCHPENIELVFQRKPEDGLFFIPFPDTHDILAGVSSPNVVLGPNLQSILASDELRVEYRLIRC